jgi:hypothetical protein
MSEVDIGKENGSVENQRTPMIKSILDLKEKHLPIK